MPPNAQIIIKRSSESINTVRDFKIMVDGKKIGWIADGQTKTFDIPAGSHELQIQLEWASSHLESFVLTEGESKKFSISSSRNAKRSILTAVVISIVGPILAGLFHSNYFLFLYAPIILILIYYNTFGRKTFLSVSEIEG